MWNPTGEVHGLAGPHGHVSTTDHRRQGAADNEAFFILKVVNVQGGTLSMRGQRAPQSEDDFSVALQSSNLEDLAGVSILQAQCRRGRWTRYHGCSIDGMPH